MVSGLDGPLGWGRLDGTRFGGVWRDSRRQKGYGGITLDIGAVRPGGAWAVATPILHPFDRNLVDEAVLEMERRCAGCRPQAMRLCHRNVECDPIRGALRMPSDPVLDRTARTPLAHAHCIVGYSRLQSFTQPREFLTRPFRLSFQFCQPVACHIVSPGRAGLRARMGSGIVGTDAQAYPKLFYSRATKYVSRLRGPGSWSWFWHLVDVWADAQLCGLAHIAVVRLQSSLEFTRRFRGRRYVLAAFLHNLPTGRALSGRCIALESACPDLKPLSCGQLEAVSR